MGIRGRRDWGYLGGGGILVLSGAKLTVIDSTVRENTGCSTGCAHGFGGGIFNDQGGELVLERSVVTANTACTTASCNGHGAGVANFGTAMAVDSVLAGNVGCTNSCNNGEGGGIYTHIGTLSLTNSTVSGNSACSGTCSRAFGGGIFDGATLTVTDSTVSGNTACSGSCLDGLGGGIIGSGTVTVTDSTVSGNTSCSSNACTDAGLGGGIVSSITLALTNSTVSGNTACSNACGGGGGIGGGIYSDGPLTLTNSTVSGNTACTNACGGGIGGGIDEELQAATLSNTILAGNVAPAGGADCHGSLMDGKPDGSTTVGHNLIGNGTYNNGTSTVRCGLTDGSNGDQVGTSETPIDPKLDPNGLRSNGGSTQTVALLPGSPAIGTGDASTCTRPTLATGAPGPNGTDQRGIPRPAMSCDIGAYQAIPTMYVATSGSDANLPCASAGSACRHIATALSFIQPDGTITVGPGTYCEQVTVLRSVTLQGTGSTSDASVIDGGTGSSNPCAAIPGDTPGHPVVTVGDGGHTTMTVTLRRLVIQHGAATGEGGGISVSSVYPTPPASPAVTLTVADSVVSENNGCGASTCTLGGGGGIDNVEGRLTVINSTISGNAGCSGSACTGAGGGGISQEIAETRVINSTIVGNTACNGPACSDAEGGGIYDDSGGILLLNSTVALNSACSGTCTATGGGIYSDGLVALANTIVADNRGGDCSTLGERDATLNSVTVGHNIVGDGPGCGSLASGTNGDRLGLDPKLDPHGLQENRGPTPTISLQAASSAIGAGDAGTCHASSLNWYYAGVTTSVSGPSDVDQRGQSRNATSRHVCDIGAYDTGGSLFPQTITFNPLPDKTYGDAPSTVSAAASSGLPVSFSAGPASVCAASGSAGSIITVKGAGQCTVTASQGGDSRYSAAPNIQQSFTIKLAPLTATADNTSMTYGAGSFPIFSLSYSGFVNGDAQGVVSGTLHCVATDSHGNPISASAPAGTYTIDCSGSSLSAANYTIRYKTGTLTIGKATLTVTAGSPSMPYGGAVPTVSASYSGFVNGDTAATALTGSPSCSTTATSHSPLGQYPTSCSQGTLAAANYIFHFINGTLTIGKAVLTVTAASPSVSYGGSVPTIGYSYSGFVNGDTAGVVSGAPSCSTTATSHSPVGQYPTSCALSSLSATNYTIRAVPGILTVEPAPLTITAGSPTITYGTVIPSITPSYSGFVNGDTPTSLTTAPTCSAQATAHSGAGTYATACSGAADPNYHISYTAGTLTITPAPLTISADDQSMVYGGNMPTLTWTAHFLNGDTAASLTTQPTCSTVSRSSHVGHYAITCSGAIDPNYTITYGSGTLTITPAHLTITASNQSVQYSDLLPVLSWTADFVNGDTAPSLTNRPACTTTAAVNGHGQVTSGPGSYPIACSGAVDTDYVIGYAGATLTVRPEDARVSYTGAGSAQTACSTCRSYSLLLGTTVRDISAVPADPATDPYPGDIRHATVTFVDRSTGSTLCTAAVGLINPADPAVGTASCIVHGTLSSGTSSASLTVGTVVGGYYARNSRADDQTVTITQPVGSHEVGGNGTLSMVHAAGTYAGDAGTVARFAVKSVNGSDDGTVPGTFTMTVQHGTHRYIITSTSLGNLSVNGQTGTLTGIANITDLGTSTVVVQSAPFALTVSAGSGTPSLGLTVWQPGGGLAFSSDWTGTATALEVLTSGTLIVQ